MAKTDTVKIKNNRPKIYTANDVVLNPGLNVLSAEDAEKFLSHPHMKIKQERGFIEVVDGKSAGKEKRTEEVGDKTAAELVEEIKASDDRAFVESMLQDERKTVQKAAQVRLDELDADEGEGEEE